MSVTPARWAIKVTSETREWLRSLRREDPDSSGRGGTGRPFRRQKLCTTAGWPSSGNGGRAHDRVS
ncbi:hypothetical protein FAIPA1_420035 [Frankia sp. AiPs1]